MKKFLFFTWALCTSLSFALPRGVSASGELLGVPSIGCWGGLPQNVTFAPAKSTYVYAGSCDLTQTRLDLPVSAPWTGVGNYEPATGKTSEDIIVPAPRIDQPSRPYGRFIVSMHCAADPWLNLSITCDQIAPTVDSPLDHTAPNAMGWKPPFALGPYIIGSINDSKRPFTSAMTEQARNDLNRQYGAFQAKQKADIAAHQFSNKLAAGVQQQQAIIAQSVFPSILSPAAGQRFFAQGAIPIKLAPPKSWNVTGYMISIQRRDASGNWIVQTNIPVAAADAQSAQGYMGFGAGGAGPTKSAAFLTAPGYWGVKAQVLSPTQSGWSNLVEFIVMAPKFTAPAAAARKLVK